MRDPQERIEKLGPDARLQAQLSQLDSHNHNNWILIVFAAGVLVLGALSLLSPGSFWTAGELVVRIPPQVLFVMMVGLVVVALYLVRRETEIRRLRLASLQQTLRAQAEQAASFLDTLTNVFSRNCLPELLQGEIARAERNQRPLALLMCDIDNFKLFNDRNGHLMGDYVLAQVAGIIKACVRGSDYVVRYGGDEFLVILPETEEEGAETVRRRMKEKVAEWDRQSRGGDIPIAISLGLYHHVPGDSTEKDLEEVDGRMYADKRKAGLPSAVAPRALRSG